jgi:outer membrane protein assembly factor BamB
MIRRTNLVLTLAAVLVTGTVLSAVAGDSADENWPGFRGSQASGLSLGSPPPIDWSVEEGRNIKWKTEIPGLSHSSPIVWGDQVFVTTAYSPEDKGELKVGLYGDIQPVEDDSVYEWRLYALDKNSGEVLWHRTAHKGAPAIKRHTKATHANTSPATDGKRVVAFFGSEGLHAFDLEGEPLWSRDLGVLDSGFFRVPTAQWGFASSPLLVDDKVVVQCDVQGQSYIAAFDAATGEPLWRTDRDEVPTWSTPTAYEEDGRKIVAVNGWKHIGGYDLETGEEVWYFEGGGDIPVPTPILTEDLIVITNAHGGKAPIYAIRRNARGDLTLGEGESSNEGIAWSTDRDGGYMQTPVVVGDYLYVCRDNGVVGCYRVATGEEVYRHRLGRGGTSGFSGSAVATPEHLYFTNETGDVFVVRTGPEF